MKPIYAQENADPRKGCFDWKMQRVFDFRELRLPSVKHRFIELSFLFIGINEIMNKFRGYFVIINEEMMITRYSFHSDIFKVIKTILPFFDSFVEYKRIFWIPCNTLMVILSIV